MNLDPPPSQVKLVDETMPDQTWKNWFHNFYQWAIENMSRDFMLDVPAGKITGHSSVNKFGKAPDFDTGDGRVTVWDGANDGGIDAMAYTYSSTADIGILSCDAAGTQDIEIQGLDTDYALVTQTITLNGTTDVDISAAGGTDLIRVFRMKNVDSTDLGGSVYLRTNGSTATAGVPDTANTVRAIITHNGSASNNQTLMAIYTVPAGKTAYLTNWYAATAGASKTAQYEITLWARSTGGVFQIKHTEAFSDAAKTDAEHYYQPYNKFTEKVDLEMRVETPTGGVSAASIAAGFDLILVDN